MRWGQERSGERKRWPCNERRDLAEVGENKALSRGMGKGLRL